MSQKLSAKGQSQVKLVQYCMIHDKDSMFRIAKNQYLNTFFLAEYFL